MADASGEVHRVLDELQRCLELAELAALEEGAEDDLSELLGLVESLQEHALGDTVRVLGGRGGSACT